MTSAVCRCGEAHSEPRSFYVSIWNHTDNAGGGRARLAAGPYTTHTEALDRVEPARRIAEKLDPRTVFYAWGTLSLPPAVTTRPGLTEYVEREIAKNEEN